MVFITKYIFSLSTQARKPRRPATKRCSGTGLHAEKKGNDELLEAASGANLPVCLCYAALHSLF